MVLVSGHAGIFRPVTMVWSLADGGVEEWSGVQAMDLAVDGTLLGKANDAAGEPVAYMKRPSEDWKELGTDAGWYATSMNDRGDIVGAAVVDGFWRPWIREPSGAVIWLPYLQHHWCLPNAISNSRVIVGEATADHGSHALVWRPTS